ncbi:MAG: ferritin [Lepagella sp.]
MISQKMQDALNGQIVAEIWSANLYLSMSFFFEGEGFTGFANWMKKQSLEEMSHAYMIADFVIKRGGKAVLGQIDAVPQSWESPLAAFENVYAHECKVSALINNLLELAKAEHDFASEDFLWQFVREQVEEEATASGIVDRLKRMGATAIFNLDQEYGARK